LLKVNDLSVNFSFRNQHISILKDISFSLNKGEILGIIGHSGSGKSMTALSIMGLVGYNNDFSISGKIIFDGQDILKVNDQKLCSIRGAQISMIIQQPMEACFENRKAT
jgi:ABC-type microcin C transport system duplicated ATPase subunit YejF